MKSLWASIQGDPVFMQRVNGWLTIFWIAMIPISIATGWINSITYVASLSLWALVSGHWSAWQAARVEVAQKQEAERAVRRLNGAHTPTPYSPPLEAAVVPNTQTIILAIRDLLAE